MDFKSQSQWRRNASVLKKGTSPGGQIVYKGEAVLYEENEEGERQKRTNVHKFLIRIGKQVSETVEGTKQDAENKLLELLAKHRNGGIFRSPKMLLKTYLMKHYLPDCRQRKVAPKTYRHYEQDITNHIIPLLGTRPLGELGQDSPAIESFVLALRNERGLSSKSAKHVFGCLRAAFNRGVALGFIKEHKARAPFIDLKRLVKSDKLEKARKKKKSRAQAWRHTEVLHFFHVAPRDEEMTRMSLVGCRTGMRPGELCARTWGDLLGRILEIWTSVFENDPKRLRENPGLKRWEIGDIKAGEGRAILLDDETLEALAEQRRFVDALFAAGEITEEAARFIFPARKGGENPFLSPAKAYNRWKFFVTGNKNRKKPAADKDPSRGGRPPRKALPGVRFISLYGWRHTHATELLRRREPEKLIAERLGTSVEMIRKHYGHILAETEAAAIESLPSYRSDTPASSQDPDEDGEKVRRIA